MAKRFTLQLIMDLASQIGANPAKALSRSNVSFLGKGPQQNPLFQRPLPGLENATTANLGKPETLFKAVEDAVGWAKDGKLNSIQTEILGQNLVGIRNIVKPPPAPVLPSAQMLQFPKRGSGITGIKTEGTIKDFSKASNERFRNQLADDLGSRLPEPGPGEMAAYTAMNAKTGMSRAIARQLLQQDTRLKLTPEELFMLKEGKGEPLDLMRKYYGRSMANYDDFMDEVFASGDMVDAASLKAWNPKDVATRILSDIELIPQFAQGGLARILEV